MILENAKKLRNFKMIMVSLNMKMRKLVLTGVLDRYIAVCHPIRARKIRTKTYGWLLASVAWLFSLGLSSQGLYRLYRLRS